ncbi:MAG: CoA-binding protein [Deltaproteobacteria bacterium]|nr:CoA-binding protein [Deltaproteobacteria bacterium]
MGSYTHQQLEEFLSPRNIAVIGASPNNQWFGNILENALKSGFDGQFYPVNPRTDEVRGIRAYRSISDLPDGKIDLAILLVKSSIVLETLEKLRKKGITNVLLVSSGFAETGEEGRRMQDRLRQYCTEHGIVLMGPNCLGFMNLQERVSAFCGGAVEGELIPGAVGVVGQSGATSEAIITKILKKSVGASLYLTTGNEAMLTVEDWMEYLVYDESTRVITCFVEEFRDIEKLRQVAFEAARRKIPIIILKIGRSAKGRKVAISHTGALAGNDNIVDGLFKQLGIVRVETIEELAETAVIFSRCGLPKGKGLGICTFSGGLSGLYADLCEKYGIELPSLQEKTIQRLEALLPEVARPDNPLDVTGSGFLQGLNEIVRSMLEDENLDIVAPMFIPPQDKDDPVGFLNESYMSLIDTVEKPVVPIIFREMTEYAEKYLHDKGLYFIDNPDIGVKAVSHLIEYAGFLRHRACF